MSSVFRPSSPRRESDHVSGLDLSFRKDVSSMDALTLLHPFLEVIRSGETSGPITSTALSSVDKFITYQLIHSNSPSLSLAMANISSAATHCKFEASDSTSDEVVLLKILDVLKNALICGLGETLSDEAVCEMMETGLSMCCQMRLSGESSLAVLSRPEGYV